MSPIVVLADDEIRNSLSVLDAQMQASLALSRVTLCALAALSPLLSMVTDTALAEEAETVARRALPASQQVIDIVETIRARLQRAPAEARMALSLEQALMDAANALQSPDDRLRLNAGQAV